MDRIIINVIIAHESYQINYLIIGICISHAKPQRSLRKYKKKLKDKNFFLFASLAALHEKSFER
jgi:hypothetical protein